LYFGGNSGRLRFQNLQFGINDLIKLRDNDDNNISDTYKELLNNIKINDVCFNISGDGEHIIGQSNIDIIVDKKFNGEEHTVVILHNVKTIKSFFFISRNSFTTEIKTGKKLFAIDQSQIIDNKSKFH